MIIKPGFERSLESIFGVNDTGRAAGGFPLLCGLVRRQMRDPAFHQLFWAPLQHHTSLCLGPGLQLSGGEVEAVI